jgi:tRNA(Ile)-lysidine synthase
MLLRTIRAAIEKHDMLARGDLVLVAVSGGPDSVALLHALHSLRAVYGIRLHAAHLEHGLRGEAGVEDMQFVESLCAGMGVPATSRRTSILERAEASTLSIEAVARQARYAFLSEVAKETGAARIATGHNANDQAETVLLNLIRGSGVAGLRGIRPAIEGKIIRPLIEAKRDEVLLYLKEKGLDFRTDASNLDDAYDRNRVRKTLLPLLEAEFNPRMVDSLVRTASVFSLVAEYLDERVAEVTEASCKFGDGRITVDLGAFAPAPRVIKLFTLYSLVRSLEGDDQVVSFDMLTALANFAERSKSGSRIDVGSGIVAAREFANLTLGRDVPLAEPYEVVLAVPGETPVTEAGLVFETAVLGERPPSADLYKSSNAACFDLDKLTLPLAARNWREGDKIRPFGLSGSKKIHDVFIDEKVPVSERSHVPIVADQDDVIWVAGVRRSDKARVTDQTRTVIRIAFRKDGQARGSQDR